MPGWQLKDYVLFMGGSENGRRVVVVPTKSGHWRNVWMSDARIDRFRRAWREWWEREGHRLAVFPWMWSVGGNPEWN